jgi:ATP-dependent DNA helicase PIF1
MTNKLSTDQLNPCQKDAFETLLGTANVFLTGGAGSGKSFVIRHFIQKRRGFPVLASTGAAAVLIGGRTFHSFFGLGILEGGVDATVAKALRNKRVCKRLCSTDGVVIDEISMIPGAALRAAETICRLAREGDRPWGGLRVIAVGDFAQLPPVSIGRKERDWAFLDEVWTQSAFVPAVLKTIVRTEDPRLLRVLERVRSGIVDKEVTTFLNERLSGSTEEFDGTRLYPHRETTERHNLARLEKIQEPEESFETVYSGKETSVSDLKRSAPVPETLRLKKGALVMIRQNDPDGRWVNGSIGHIVDFFDDCLGITLKNGAEIELERATFHLLNADGERVASASNYPVTLAYASTIHKAQGTTLDRMMVDLRGLWEPGHAYVALSRVRSSEGLFIQGWQPNSVIVDPLVTRFHRELISPS